MTHSRARSAFALIAAAGLPAAAQTITRVVAVGDPVVGVGNVTVINNVAVNNSGQWLVEADTDNLDTNVDEVRIRSGVLFLREGQSLVGVTPGGLGSFDSINLNSAGDSAVNLFLENTGSTSTDSGMFFNGTKIFQEGAISTAPQFSANTPYIGFFESRINDSNLVLVVASIDDPAIASTVDRALVLVSYNPVAGTFTEFVLAKEGQTLPGMIAAIADFGTGPHNSALNNNGDVIFVATVTGGASDAVYINQTQLAMDGTPSPVAGRNWLNVGSSGCHLNNSGGYVYTGTLAGDAMTDFLIVKNGAKFRQEGDAPPGIAGSFAITSFGSGNIVQISDSGKVLWLGDWNDPETSRDVGLFLDNQILLQEGVTQVDGLTVATIQGIQDSFQMSPNGRYIIAEVTLTDGINPARGAALLIDMGAPTSCYANCDESTGTPSLTANDFQCFLNKFAASDPYANCDESTGTPSLTANDFQCFLNKFAGGCS